MQSDDGQTGVADERSAWSDGRTEELKKQDQMVWVGRMNNIRACAEEIVVKEIVYA